MPCELAAGTTLEYLRALPGHAPVDGWTLQLALRGRNVTPLVFDASTEDDTHFHVTVEASETASIEPGLYDWQELVTDGTRRYVVAAGRITVTPDLTVAGVASATARLELLIEAVEVKLGQRIEADVERYSIINRSIEHIPFKDLEGYLARLKSRLETLRTGRFSRQVNFAFTGTGLKS
ncbi:MAG TPA: hypothetical protein VIV56_16900 [Gemmatimonadales bacterium]